jgi:hypothetical protein
LTIASRSVVFFSSEWDFTPPSTGSGQNSNFGYPAKRQLSELCILIRFNYVKIHFSKNGSPAHRLAFAARHIIDTWFFFQLFATTATVELCPVGTFATRAAIYPLTSGQTVVASYSTPMANLSAVISHPG